MGPEQGYAAAETCSAHLLRVSAAWDGGLGGGAESTSEKAHRDSNNPNRNPE